MTIIPITEIEAKSMLYELEGYTAAHARKDMSTSESENEAITAAFRAARDSSRAKLAWNQERLRLLVNEVWQYATESTAVPSTKTADMLIDRAAPQPTENAKDALKDALKEAAEWCATEREKLGAIDGYGYRSGEEYGLRRAEIELVRRAAAP